jgi:hypothetical protein
MPERGKGFVVVEGVGQEIGIDEDAAEDRAVTRQHGEPGGVELRKPLHRAAMPAMRDR